MQQQKAIGAAPAYLKARVEQEEVLPRVEMATPGQHGQTKERMRATAAFVVGLEEDGVEYEGLPRELLEELLGYIGAV